MSDFNSIFDASVVGGGIVGKTAALALARTGLRVALLARAPAPLPANAAACDGRVYAVSGGTQRLLERLRVWQALDLARLSPMYDMRVYGDAHAELHFSAFQAAVPELAWIVESSLLEGALDTALGFHPSVEILNASAQKLRVSSGVAALELEDGAPLKARLVVGADGAHSWVRAQSGIPCTQREYGQTALTAQFQAEQPHREAAYQWFRNGEIIALLPLPENKVSLVWSAHTPHARALRALDVPSFAAAVEQGSERRLGALQCLSPVRGFALALCKASRLIAPRVALVGDAAHVIHPLAGQGLNLGVRDVAALARTVAAREPFRDPGDPVLLRRYERSRRADIQLLMAATDGLYRLFSWSGAVPCGVRDAGFKLVDAMPRIKPALDALKAKLQKSLGPEMKIQSVAPTPVPGLYELNLGKAILYSDAQGAYLLIGKMVNAKTMENITDRRLTELNRIDFKSLPFANAIKVVKGNGARQIAVFSDPNCKHCRELEHTLSKADNLTIYTFPFPILKPDSLDKAKAIWCAPNRSAAWHAWMANRQAPGGKVSCDTDALAQNIAFGRRLNVFSTPTIFFANGYRLAGALTSEQLERAFSAVQ